MPWIRVGDVAKYGVIQDVPAKELPPGAWTDARNVRFWNNRVDPIHDPSNVSGPSLSPVYIGAQFLNSNGGVSTLYAGADRVTYVNETLVHTDATGGLTFSVQPGHWTVTKMGSVPVLNARELTTPLWWDDSTKTVIQLPNWPAGLQCHALRSFKNHLLALRCIESGTEYPHMIRWSHPADPGTPPSSWDYTNPTLDAGRVEIGELDTPIVDGQPLGPAFFVYRQGSVHRLDYIGPPLVFSIQTVFDNFGALALNCVQSWRGLHIVMTADDIVAHDGQQVRSLLNNRLRDYYTSAIGAAADLETAFLALNPALDEAWAFLPNSTAGQPPQHAIVINLRTGACTIVDETAWSAWFGVPLGQPDGWDSGDADTWDTGPDVPWNQSGSGASALRLYLGRDTEFAVADSGAVKPGLLERIGLPLGDHNQRAMVRRLRFTASDVSGLTVRAGAANDLQSPPVLSTGVSVPSNGDVPVLQNGIWHAMRLEWGTGATWNGLTGYAADVVQTGEY